MGHTTYSFLDSVIILTHPTLQPEPIVLTGEGVGSVSVSMTEERTAMETAADGSVMVSKIAGNLGSVSVNVQQTSNAHKALLTFFGKIIGADALSWAQAVMIVRNITDGTSHICTGVAPTKIPDKAYGKTGAHIDWKFMAADIQSAAM